MTNKLSRTLIFAVFALFLTGCANSDLSHRYLMRGQVVSASPDNIVVCVGYDDGAEVGQIFDTYRFTMNDDNEEGAEFFQKVEKGQIIIEEIIDEHFAKVSVLKGQVKKFDFVQLNR